MRVRCRQDCSRLGTAINRMRPARNDVTRSPPSTPAGPFDDTKMTVPAPALTETGTEQPTQARPRAGALRLSSLTLAGLAVIWLIGTLLAFRWKSSQLLIGFDGGYMLDLARRQFAWQLPLFSSSIDWIQGLGDIYFAVNFRLLPAFNIAALLTGFSSAAAKVVIYETMLLEVTAAIILFALSLGVPRPVAVCAAALTCFVFMPFAHPSLIYGILAMIPHLGSLIAAALLAAAAFLQFGRRHWLTDFPFAVAALGLVAWSAQVSGTIVLLAAPFFLLCVISGIVAAESLGERRCKLALLVAILVLTAIGPALYLISTILDTAAVAFPAELANDRGSFFFASILFQGGSVGPVGPIFMLSGIAGAALSAFNRRQRTLRVFAITLLTYLGTRLTFAAFVILFDFWRGPAPLYFEFFVIPLYGIFAVMFWAALLGRLYRLLGWTIPTSALELRIVAVFVVMITAVAISTAQPDYRFPYPPKPNQLTDLLAKDTGLHLGSEFRGRTATMTGRALGGNVDWLALHGLDGGLTAAAGNELRLVGLHYFGIPTLFEYTPTITPAFYAATTRLLAQPGDRQMRNVVVTRQINSRILAMLGVRFVITDQRYDGPALLRDTYQAGDHTLLLYEISNPNLGNYSPTVVKPAGNASAILARLADPSFDSRQEMIAGITDSVDGLVPARNVKFVFEGASLRLHAESDGRSALLLPLEFSSCLTAEGADARKITLFRANLLETGVLFAGRVDMSLSIRTGPFLNPACRLWDFFEARKLGFDKVLPLSTAALNGD